MAIEDGIIVFSPSDLTGFMESPFASWMDRLYLEFPDRYMPDEVSDGLQLYADAGITHEADFVKETETKGGDLCWINGNSREVAEEANPNAVAVGRVDPEGRRSNAFTPSG